MTKLHRKHNNAQLRSCLRLFRRKAAAALLLPVYSPGKKKNFEPVQNAKIRSDLM